MVELDKWIEKVKRCEFLAEDELKSLCEYVSSCCSWGLLATAAAVAVQTQPLRPLWLALICLQVKEILVEESNVQPVQGPVTVCLARSCTH
jgi:serine/threonine-protein phosphatase 6 catalytic subunit